jgi:hypothetical protein
MSDDTPLQPAFDPVGEPAVDGIVEAWCEMDHGLAFLASDHDAVEATRALRALVVESLLHDPDCKGRDVLHAFGSVGRVVAERGGSPTLAASTIDGLLAALTSVGIAPGASGYPFATPARAAVAESYVLARGAACRAEAVQAWEYPACAVPVTDELIAIAAGYPDDDDEALAGWASRVVRGITVGGMRKAVLSGSAKAIAALEDALELAGIERVERRTRGATRGPVGRPR